MLVGLKFKDNKTIVNSALKGRNFKQHFVGKQIIFNHIKFTETSYKQNVNIQFVIKQSRFFLGIVLLNRNKEA
jgi:hypothetical protein